MRSPAIPIRSFSSIIIHSLTFANFADGTAGKAEHLKDEANFFDDLASGKLPAVSFVKPIGEDNEHPGYASLARGQQHVADVVEAIRRSPVWNDTAIRHHLRREWRSLGPTWRRLPGTGGAQARGCR